MASLEPRPAAPKEMVDRLFKPAVQQMLKSPEWNQSLFRALRQFARQMKTVDRVEEKQRAHALVE